MKFTTLMKMADNVMYYKYIVRNVSRRYGKTATFMPKPIFGDNGSGMHTHQSLWKGNSNLFWDDKGYAQISEAARFRIIRFQKPSLHASSSGCPSIGQSGMVCLSGT